MLALSVRIIFFKEALFLADYFCPLDQSRVFFDSVALDVRNRMPSVPEGRLIREISIVEERLFF